MTDRPKVERMKTPLEVLAETIEEILAERLNWVNTFEPWTHEPNMRLGYKAALKDITERFGIDFWLVTLRAMELYKEGKGG